MFAFSACRGALAVDTGQAMAPRLAQLSPDEQHILLQLPTERQRRHSLLARLAGHRAIQSLLDPYSSRIEILQAPNGSPLASIEGQPGLVSLSLSHSDRLAIAVAWKNDASRGYSVGVDLERLRETEIAESRYAFSRRERKLIQEAPCDPKLSSLAAWIAKEAAWKAMRPEPEYGPDTVEVQALDLARGYAAVKPAGRLCKRYGETVVEARLAVVRGAGGRYLLGLAELCHPAVREGQVEGERIEK